MLHLFFGGYSIPIPVISLEDSIEFFARNVGILD
jgi:hypothetical protein